MGLYLRLEYDEQEEVTWLLIAMKPCDLSMGKKIFRLEHQCDLDGELGNNGDYILDGGNGNPDNTWELPYRFIFCRKKLKK